jgi:hypothetical protein
MTTFAPLQELLSITEFGKTLPDSITQHVIENGVQHRIEQAIE